MTNTWNIYLERLLPIGDPGSLVPGAHLVTPRRRYVHHGIYTGSGRVEWLLELSPVLLRRLLGRMRGGSSVPACAA